MSENDKPVDETQPVRPQGQPDTPAGPTPEPAAATTPAAAPGPAPDPTPDPAPVAAATPAPATGPARSRFRRWREQQRGDRTYGLAALIASVLAGIIVGGVGTAVFHAVTDDHDRGGWVERRGPMGRHDVDREDDRGPWFGGPDGVPGEVEPTTPPEDDSGTSS